MRILGLSAFYHDSAAALVEDGRIVAAAQEERFTRRKHDAGYPAGAVAACLAQAGAPLDEVDRVVFYDKPFLKFERLLETALSFAPRGFGSFALAAPVWIKEKLFQKDLLRRRLTASAPAVDWNERLLFAEHHQSHAASAFYPSPFPEAVVLTMDGVGEWATTSVGIGRGTELTIEREIHFPHSLGLLYSAFTHHLGFRVNSGEYKVMGLAPYGEPRYAAAILEHLVDLKRDGSFRLDLSFFDYCTGFRMTNRRFESLFGGPARRPEEALTRREVDLAASVQAVVEEVVLRLARSLREETGIPRLCLAGGVALNSVANGKVLRDGKFADLWVQPAAGDAGGALGAALVAAHRLFGAPRRIAGGNSAGRPRDAEGRRRGGGPVLAGAGRGEGPDGMRGAFLGPEYSEEEIVAALRAAGARYEVLEEAALIESTAAALASGRAAGWFQGRMEFGPRALGNRSILADPRSPTMQRTLNLKIKRRESFRPFAPSVPRSEVGDWFDFDGASPYMALVVPVHPGRRSRDPGAETLPPDFTDDSGDDFASRLGPRRRPRSEIPAVTHVDGSARVQTVHEETNPRFHALLKAFGEKTGCPVLVNTSFNVRGEPIVCSPEDALRCFLGAGLDLLVIGDCFLRREEQDPSLFREEHAASFAPD